jgi:hypothetical protein
VDWIYLAEKRVMNIRVSSSAGNFFADCGTTGSSRMSVVHGVISLVTNK